MFLSIEQQTHFIKQQAQQLGFSYCGIAKAMPLYDDAKRLEQWLNKGMHGQMKYMENYFDMRINPKQLVPNAQSVITLLKNYYPAQQQQAHAPFIAKYAYGKDYHEVIRTQLHQFLQQIRQNLGHIEGRGFVDSAPVLERSWAQRSGLGWIGKNGNLIHKQAGSFFFIATLIVDIPLLYDNPMMKDYCGTCTQCIDACPTNAILPNKEVNGSACISYYTIELKDALQENVPKHNFNNWMFGCDICQDVCPWNRFSKPHNEPSFEPLQEVLQFSIKDWIELTEESFKKTFKHSPIKRTKHSGMLRNATWLLKK